MEVKPNSRNVVPGEVFFSVDLRHPDEAVLDQMEAEFRASLPQVLEPLGLTFEEKRIWKNPAVRFHPILIACVREGAKKSAMPCGIWSPAPAMMRPTSRASRRRR